MFVIKPVLDKFSADKSISELGDPVNISKPSLNPEDLYEDETKNLRNFSDITFTPKPEADEKDIDISKLKVKSAEEFLYGDRPKELYISQGPEREYSLIESGIKKISNILGFESPLAKDKGITDVAKAQALVQIMASEEGIPVSEFRNSPGFIEKFAQGFTDVASLGILPALKEATTGETEFASDSYMEYAGKGLGSFAGLLFGPAKVGELIASPITSRIAVTRDMPLAVRTLKQGLKEALILSPTIGAAVFGESLKEKSFKDAAGIIVSGLGSGALTGAIFGVSRGLFPQEVRHRAARIITGLVGLNAQRALENPDVNIWDRPMHEVIFDTAMDVFFMWKGLSRRGFTEFERLTDKMLRDEELTTGEFDSIIAELHRLKKEASRENNKEVENILNTKKTSPPKPKPEDKPEAIVRPADVNPNYTFTSKKGNYYEKIGDKWFDSKGKEVTNRFVIDAAERSKVKFGVDEDAASDMLIAELETKFKKNIDDITDKEIEDYIVERELAKEEVEVGAEPEPLNDIENKKIDVIKEGINQWYSHDKDILDNELSKFNENIAILRGKDRSDYINTIYNFLNSYLKTKPDEPLFEFKMIPLSEMMEGTDPSILREKKYKRGLRLIEGKDSELEFEPTSFRQTDKKFTKEQLKLLPPYKKIDNVHTLMSRMETEVNAWLDGEDINVDPTKVLIEQLADNSKLWADGSETPPGMFADMTLAEIENFSEYMKNLNSWVGKLDRSSVRLNMMIPLDQIPKVVVDIISKSKSLIKDLYRNKDIWKNTGFWLGKDGKWRYEIDDSKAKYNIPDTLKEEYSKNGFTKKYKIRKVLQYSELYNAVPEIKNTKILYTKYRDIAGTYNPGSNTIIVNFMEDRQTFFHELQHVVNSITGSKFKGTSPTSFNDRSDAMNLYLKDPGEMESRLAERRMGMTPEERKQWAPWDTLDEMLGEEGIAKEEGEWYSNKPGTKLYSGIPVDIEDMKTIFDKLTGRNKTKILPKPPDPFKGVKEEGKDLIIRRVGKLAKATYDTNLFVNSVEQRTTKNQQDVMMFVIEKTDIPDELGRPDLQKVLKRDRKYLEPIAEEIKDHFETGFKRVKAHLKDLSAKQIRDYVTHIWDIPRHERAKAIRWFSTQDRFMERRFIETYAEGIKQGFNPKTLNILEIIKIHDAVGNRAIENVRYIESLRSMEKEGVKLLTRNSDEAPIDWIAVNYPALTRRVPLTKTQIKRKGAFVKESEVYVHPDLVRPIKIMFEERFDHPIISTYEAINGYMKKSMLSLNLFHHTELAKVSLAELGLLKTADIYLNPVKIYKAMVKGEFYAYKNVPIARDAAEHTLQFGASADIPVERIQMALNSLAEKTRDVPMAGRITRLVADMNSVWDKALWTYLHDTIKLYAYETSVSKLDPNLDPEVVRKSKIEIAQRINDIGGGQNWATLGLTPKEVQMMTWNLLSADWTVSTIRQGLSPIGIGRIYKETTGLRAKGGLMFGLRAILYFGIGLNLLNAYFRDMDMKKNPQYYPEKDEYTFLDKTMFWGNTEGSRNKLFIGRYSDGSERHLRWDKQIEDCLGFIYLPWEKKAQKLGGKIAPAPQAIVEAFTGHSLSGFRNDDIYGQKSLNYLYGVMKRFGSSFLPISFRRALDDKIDFKFTDVFSQSSKGMSRHRAVEGFKKSIKMYLDGRVEDGDDVLRDFYIGALRNNLPAYTLFNSALAWTEAEISTEMTKNVDDIETVKAKLKVAENAFDRKRWGQKLAQLQREKADKEAGLKLFKTALERVRIYSELEGGKVPRLPK